MMFHEVEVGIHVPHRAPSPAALGYNAEFDAASALSRTRRTLREARHSIAQRPNPIGVHDVEAMIRGAVSRGFCSPCIDGLGDGRERDALARIPARQLAESLDRSLSRLDGLVADITEPMFGQPDDTVSVMSVDGTLGSSLAQANRRLRNGDATGLASLDAAAARLAVLAGTDIQSLGDRLGLRERTRHLVGVLARHTPSVPLGTMAFALFTLEALAYRFAKRPLPRRLSA